MMTVTQAVEAADQALEEANQAPSLATIVRTTIDRQLPAFEAVLPASVDPERFARLTLTAIKAAPQLMDCFGTEEGQASVLLAAMQAATIGLEPNTDTQDCWILPRKEKGRQLAELQLGYRGLMKLARRAGTIETIYAEVVRQGDDFDWYRGLERDHLEHRKAPRSVAGELTHAYAVARFIGGGYSFEVLEREDIEARKAMSRGAKSEYSPWVKWPERMWKKSAIRALMPYLDMSAEDMRAVSLDDTVLRVDGDSLARLDDVPAIEAGESE